MSASSSRKKRQEQAQIPASQTPKKKKKLSQGWIFGITIVAIVVAMVAGILIYRTVRNNRTVLTVGDYKVSVREFNYFYNNTANGLASYASSLGIESGKALNEQYVSSDAVSFLGLLGANTDALTDKQPVDGFYDVTWAQIIASTARDSAINAYAIYNEAMAAGYKIDEHLQHEIDEQIAVMQGYADTNGESLNALIERVYGSGCNLNGYRHYLEVVGIADHYPSERVCSADEIAARFEQEPEKFTVASYYLYSVSGADLPEEATEPTDEEGNVTEPTDEEGNVIEPTGEEATEPEATEEEVTEPEASEEEATEPEASEEEATEPEVTEEGTEQTDEEGNVIEPTEEEGEAHDHEEEVSEEDRQKAEELAKAMEQDFDVDNEKVATRTDNTRETVTSAVNEEAAAWLFDTAKDGDVKLFEKDGTYYVLKLIDKTDYLTINVLQIYIAADAEGGPAEGELSAAEKVEKIKEALNADASEEKFKALMEEYGAEAEPIENLTRASVASVSNELLTWHMGEAEKGKWIAAESNGATIFLYCLGRGDNYHTVAVRNTLNSEWRESVITAAKAAAVYDEAAAMTANVGLSFN